MFGPIGRRLQFLTEESEPVTEESQEFLGLLDDLRETIFEYRVC